MTGPSHPPQNSAKKGSAAWRGMRYLYLRFIRLKDDPRTLARGFAIGTFVGVTPTIPFHTILALGLALICRGSKIAAILATVLVSNPLTFWLQYYLAWKIGNWITPADLSWERISAELEVIRCGAGFSETLAILGKMSMDTLVGLILGGCLLALPIAALSYGLALYFSNAIRKKRRKKHVLN